MIVRHLELSPGTKTVKHLQLSIFHHSSCQFFEMSLIKIDIFDISLIKTKVKPLELDKSHAFCWVKGGLWAFVKKREAFNN